MKLQVGQRIEVFNAVKNWQGIRKGNTYVAYRKSTFTNCYPVASHREPYSTSLQFTEHCCFLNKECRPVGAMIIKEVKK